MFTKKEILQMVCLAVVCLVIGFTPYMMSRYHTVRPHPDEVQIWSVECNGIEATYYSPYPIDAEIVCSNFQQ